MPHWQNDLTIIFNFLLKIYFERTKLCINKMFHPSLCYYMKSNGTVDKYTRILACLFLPVYPVSKDSVSPTVLLKQP